MYNAVNQGHNYRPFSMWRHNSVLQCIYDGRRAVVIMTANFHAVRCPCQAVYARHFVWIKGGGAFRESNSLNKFYSAAVVVCFLTRKHGFITKTSMRKSFLLLWLHCFATCMAVKSHKRQQQNEKRHGNIYHIPYINNLMSCTHFSHTKYSNGRPCPIKTWDVIHSFLFSIGI